MDRVQERLFHIPSGEGDEPYLIGNRCRACGSVFFPPKGGCPNCLREDTLESIPIGRRGRISSFSILHVAPPGFPVPHVQAMIRLDEGPLVFSLLKDVSPEPNAVAIGDAVRLFIGEVRKDEHGNPIIGWLYRPVSNERREDQG